MTITFKTGNLFYANVDALVNPINCVGVSGKGLAYQFKQRFPENHNAYYTAATAERIFPGEMFITQGPPGITIINFPTKRHWRNPSRIVDIALGLINLRDVIERHNIKSIAIPALGCGNGELDWGIVKPLITAILHDMANVDIWLYEPMEQ